MVQVVHLVISLQPGGLERLVVDMTNERNRRMPGSARVCCLDEPGLLAEEVVSSEQLAVSREKRLDNSVICREGRNSCGRGDESANQQINKSSGRVVFCVNAKRSRFPWDREAVERLRETLDLRPETIDFEGGKSEVGSQRSACPPKPWRRREVGDQIFESMRYTPCAMRRAIVLHAHNMAAWQYAVLAARGTGVKVVYTQHGANPHSAGWFNRLRAKLLMRYTGRIVAVSKATAGSMAKLHGIPGQRIEVIHNGTEIVRKPPINADERRLLKERQGLPTGSFVVGSAGRFSVEKNYPLLVEAFAELHRKNADVRLLLVGDGPDMGRIEAIIEKHGLGDVCLLPGYQDNVEPWINVMDVFCLSSDSEGVPLALLEAGAHGIPAVVTDVGGNAEIVEDGKGGFVVPHGDHRAMVEALEKLCVSAGKREQTGTELQKKVMDEFSFGRMMDEYDEIYDGEP